MKSSFAFTLSVLILNLASFSCRDRGGPALGGGSSKVTRYIVHGEIKSLYAGSTQNKISPFKIENLLDFKNFRLGTITRFSTQSNTDNDFETNYLWEVDVGDFQFVVSDQNLVYNEPTNQLKFNFVNENSQYNLKTIDSPWYGTLQTEVIHYSVANNKKSFSILFKTKDNSSLYNLVFYSLNGQEEGLLGDALERTSPYSWILDKPTRWKQNLNFQICKKNLNFSKVYDLSTIVSDSINDFNNSTVTKNFLSYSTKDQFPPFSDLNTHCLYVIDDYLQKDDAILMGEALMGFDLVRDEILDGDIFIMNKELRKLVDLFSDDYSISQAEERTLTYLKSTIRHELGHVLGLGHLVPKECGEKSIMCYGRNPNPPYIKPYDIDALKYLYE